MKRMVRPFYAVAVLGWLALVGIAPALAAPPHLPSLTPPPPSFVTCRATGQGVICAGRILFDPGSGPLGLVCGTTANPVELIGTGQEGWRVTQYYDSAGKLTREILHLQAEGTVNNPATLLSARITQTAQIINTLTVPGDLASLTFQQTGVVKFYLPGGGVLLRDVGRGVTAPNGSTLVSSGQHQLDAYFSGDRAVLGPLCAALGTPGTP